MVYHRGFSLLSKLQYEAAQQLGFRRNSVRWLQVQALELHSELKELIPEQQERLKKLKSNPGKLYDIDVWMKLLPTAKPGGEPLPEGLLWLLLTGKLPTKEQVDSLSKELRSRATVPDHVYKTIDALPINADQMTQFATGVMALQVQSEFQKAYDKGIHKSNYWEPTYEDALSLIAQLPLVASYVYRRTFKNGHVIVMDDSLDYGANFAHMLGFDDPAMQELMRLYITIHADHGGGNVSAHTGRLVASALSDPYLSFAAALNGLAGPLHGLANQEFLLWIKLLVKECGENVSEENLKDFVRKTLNSGKVVPGFGHRVLESTDPRYTCLREFALKHLPEDPLFKLVSNLYKVVPPLMLEHVFAEFAQAEGRDPQLVRKSFEKGVSSEFLEICGSYGIWPNVNAHSGVLLNHYGLTEAGYHPVVFGVSRAIGICAQLIWDRALGLPLERPKSVTMEWLENYCKKTSFSSVI